MKLCPNFLFVLVQSCCLWFHSFISFYISLSKPSFFILMEPVIQAVGTYHYRSCSSVTKPLTLFH